MCAGAYCTGVNAMLIAVWMFYGSSELFMICLIRISVCSVIELLTSCLSVMHAHSSSRLTCYATCQMHGQAPARMTRRQVGAGPS